MRICFAENESIINYLQGAHLESCLNNHTHFFAFAVSQIINSKSGQTYFKQIKSGKFYTIISVKVNWFKMLCYLS